ncbi:MAG: hypothetical protein LBK67_10245 [Coriobacteriales bacterium]|jgi:DNA-binding MarR family transcriptional regulator|nr:hypothetical protein [Coriobacteriales bacterium]
MSKKGLIQFNLQVVTVFLAHQPFFSRYLMAKVGLTYSEFTLLFMLFVSRSPVSLQSASDYLVLSKKTVLTLLYKLEDTYLVTKEAVQEDRRMMRIIVSESGKELMRRALAELNTLMKDTVWKALPEQEYLEHMSNNISKGVDVLRGFSMTSIAPLRRQSGVLCTPDHCIYWRLVAERWREIVRNEGRLAFGEFGIITLLDECGDLRMSNIAGLLRLQRSGVAMYKRHLLEKGLVSERKHAHDGRILNLHVNSEGQRLSRRLKERLNAFTSCAHGPIDDDTARIINAWYFRMYSNLLTTDIDVL